VEFSFNKNITIVDIIISKNDIDIRLSGLVHSSMLENFKQDM
jgi:hypothetical protein